ncbi:hypothetical protein WI61_08130 [Burkholderia cepacia]|nr:hypothetical protein WI47_21225 [Burkholderia cepacia]KVA51577.1 hypothetical protein WI48_25970 [Burkholderia cepacia]KVA70841.1 hypothetical protein WI49_35445 [Burkholderia cepacia]KVA78901.1 hypothetical protein WI51_27685 [Burkholderia cepacia]KVA78923.1 hypothetical protein WI52_25575 [Burkholderia cepacia]
MHKASKAAARRLQPLTVVRAHRPDYDAKLVLPVPHLAAEHDTFAQLSLVHATRAKTCALVCRQAHPMAHELLDCHW